MNKYLVPVSVLPIFIVAVLESVSFEDAIRNGISIGGDSDTLCAITGAIAEAYYGMTEVEKNSALSFLDEALANIAKDFGEKYVV